MATPERELAPDAPTAPTPAVPTGLPPGPATWPPLQMLRYARRPYGSIEANARQYCPAANQPWEKRWPGIFRISDGTMATGVLTAPGLSAV